jgi:hypothetical protein
MVVAPFKKVQELPDRTNQSGTGATTPFQLSTELGTLSAMNQGSMPHLSQRVP